MKVIYFTGIKNIIRYQVEFHLSYLANQGNQTPSEGVFVVFVGGWGWSNGHPHMFSQSKNCRFAAIKMKHSFPVIQLRTHLKTVIG